jgi:MFS family permease
VTDLSRNNRWMMLALFLWASGEGLFLFIQPIYIQQLGATPAQIGGVLALAGLGLTIGYLPGGVLADRAPRKLILIGGWMVGIVAALIMALARDWQSFIPGVLLYSLSAFCVPAISATIAENAGSVPLARVLTLTYAGYWAGNIVSPWVGGWLARLTNMRVVYLVAAACFVASTLAMLMVAHRARPAQTRAQTLPSLPTLRSGAFVGLIVFGMFLAMHIGQPLAPNLLKNTAGWSVDQIGLLGSLNAAGVTLVSPLLGRWSAERKLRGLWAAQALVWTSFALLLLGAQGLPGLVYLSFFVRGGYGTCRSLTSATIAGHVAEENRGVAFGLAESAAAAAQMASPYIAGQLYGLWPAAPVIAGLGLIPAGMLIAPLLLKVQVAHKANMTQTRGVERAELSSSHTEIQNPKSEIPRGVYESNP